MTIPATTIPATFLALDELQRARLDWPEPLVLELIAEIYKSASAHDDVWTAARCHAGFLHDLIEGETGPASPARLELIATCAARGIDPAAIGRAEQAVFHELTDLVQSRFRNSPRHRLPVLAKLRAAQDALTKRVEAPRTPLRKPFVAQRIVRAPLQLRPSLVATA